MKTLTIGSKTLELNSFYKKWDRIAGVYAEIKIPTSAISYDELKALFTDNQNDLIVSDEETTESFSGYAMLDEIREKGDEYTVIQYCTSTPMHLLNETRKQIEEQNGVITAQDNELKAHAKVITAQNEQITAQNEVIEQQTALVGALEENSLMQMATIESLLLEVIPAVIAEALASNSTTE